ncbi:hypothetical protein T492DRAFT_900301 [Pavlovales sp. CCMP2436]|nr:hypothetical protein T492DRAFT_900301 [Pavlovales sp. CCMP2436]
MATLESQGGGSGMPTLQQLCAGSLVGAGFASANESEGGGADAGGRAMPTLQQLCVGSLVGAARRMRGAMEMVASSNEQLIERKLQLQVELAEVSDALETMHVARRQIVEATRAFWEDVDDSLDAPLSTQVLAHLTEAHPAFQTVLGPTREMAHAEGV